MRTSSWFFSQLPPRPSRLWRQWIAVGGILLANSLTLRAQLDGQIFRIHNWLVEQASSQDQKTHWLSFPEQDRRTSENNLYYGNAGVTLFYLEAYQALNNPDFLRTAKKGANHLASTLPDTLPRGNNAAAGLYTGLAGIGFALKTVFNTSRDPVHLRGFEQTLQLLAQSAQVKGEAARWGPVTDLLSGNAGIGLYFLWAFRETDDRQWLDWAKKAANGLLEDAIPLKGKACKWPMEPGFPRTMPNFSHGTAGVAYFLTQVFLTTQEQPYLQAALAGAAHLQKLTSKDYLIPHHEEGEGKKLFYLGFCHGPAGTARLYAALFRATGNPSWQKALLQAAEPLLASGIPEQSHPGMWNNYGQCCGHAGIGEFLLALNALQPDPRYASLTKRLLDDILQKGTRTDRGIRWIQAEHRAEPTQVTAQTGLMQGSAGIGLFLLHWMQKEQHQSPLVRFLDNPF